MFMYVHFIGDYSLTILDHCLIAISVHNVVYMYVSYE